MYDVHKLQATLPKLTTLDRDLYEIEVAPTSFIDEEGRLHISGEDGNGFVDYYGEFRGGYPYIHPELENWARELGMYWEWDNPASICLSE